MVNVLQTRLDDDRHVEDMYTIDVYSQIRNHNRGILGTYVIVKTIKESEHVDASSLDVGIWIYEELEDALEELHHPECSICGKNFGLNDRIYCGAAETFEEFPDSPLHCHNCKQKLAVAEEL